MNSNILLVIILVVFKIGISIPEENETVNENIDKSEEKKRFYLFNKGIEKFVFIPQGTTQIGEKNIEIPCFYMSECEITNAQYLEFLNDLKLKGKMNEYNIAMVDTNQWLLLDESKISKYESNYLQRLNYPVVNISIQGAELYCKWLANKISNDKYKYEIRLPTNNEWEHAARGGRIDSKYPWGNGVPINVKGCSLAQFKTFGMFYGPVGVATHFPNDYGLYDVSGNVAEMVSDTNIVKGGSWNSNSNEIQITSSAHYSVSPTVGFRPILIY
ncbi:MAG: formylglycine-generating enzyme family protein [Candidatus Methylacidiphilales bacterium]